MIDAASRTSVRAAVVVLAAGSGSRVGATVDGVAVNKVYLPLAGRPVLLWSMAAAARVPGVTRLVLVARPADLDRATAMLADAHLPSDPPVDLVLGGDQRHDSEQAALIHLEPEVRAGHLDVIAIHDGARPLAPSTLFAEVLRVAAEVGGALPGVPAGPLLALDPDASPPAGRLVRAQTPQAFRAAELLAAYAAAGRAGRHGTDTASTVERFGSLTVQVVAGSATNLKVTYPDDVAVAERLAASSARA